MNFQKMFEQQQDYNRYNHVHLSVGIEFLISFDNKINSLSMLLSRYSSEIQDANFANMFELRHTHTQHIDVYTRFPISVPVFSSSRKKVL